MRLYIQKKIKTLVLLALLFASLPSQVRAAGIEGGEAIKVQEKVGTAEIGEPIKFFIIGPIKLEYVAGLEMRLACLEARERARTEEEIIAAAERDGRIAGIIIGTITGIVVGPVMVLGFKLIEKIREKLAERLQAKSSVKEF